MNTKKIYNLVWYKVYLNCFILYHSVIIKKKNNFNEFNYKNIIFKSIDVHHYKIYRLYNKKLKFAHLLFNNDKKKIQIPNTTTKKINKKYVQFFYQ